MTTSQIDRLCTDWLREYCGEESSSKYGPYSLAIPMWNDPELNAALETLKQSLCTAFGADASFGTTDYYEARERLGLPEEQVSVPEVFLKAFSGP